jgi:hypothetical protein
MSVITRVTCGRLVAWLTVAAAIVVGSALFGLPKPANPAPVSSTGLSAQWQSTQVERLQEQLPATDVQAAIIVISRADDGVFGAATDYALLLIARYREELRRVPDRFAAMRRALRRTAEPVLASGSTVVLGVLALLLSEQESNRALAVACATGVVLAMCSALVVLPAALVLAGRGLFWPFVPRAGSPAREGRVWGRLGAAVARRPVPVAGLATLLLAGLALGGLGIRTGLSETQQFRVRPEAVGGAETLAQAFPAGTTQPIAARSWC